MKFVQNIVILVAKILIAIGDVVLLIAFFLWKLAKNTEIKFQSASDKVLSYIQTFKQKINIPHRKKFIEKEIYNAHKRFQIPSLRRIKTPEIQRILADLKPPRLEISTIRIPKFELPSIKTPPPLFEIPVLSFNKINIFHIRHRKRGKKKTMPIFVPKTAKLKYLFLGTFISFVFFFLPAIFVIFLQDLPNPRVLAHQDIAQTTKIYDRNKILLYQIYANQNRTVVPLTQIPEDLKNATIAIEDKNFYKTPGFDALAIVRSAIADFSGKPLQGGSTITQQLVKARLLTPERSIERKVKEVILSVWTERIYSKEQILEMYLNQVPYGGTAWGSQSGAETYFGKKVSELTLSESAFLAGLPQAPSVYSPYGDHPDLWKNRQKDVLNRMLTEKLITEEEKEKALKEKLTFLPARQSIKAPHFVMYTKDLLIQKYGLAMVERGGLTVITTLDLNTQEMAQKIISEEVERGSQFNFTNAGTIVTNPKNGDILAMVGGRDYYDPNGGNYNVTTALRQPGSTIKVVTYSTALMNGFTAASILQDTPVAFASVGAPPYRPVNYDGRFRGNISLRQALGNSINIPAVKTLNQVGIPKMMELAKKMGISTWGEPEEYGLALTLGAAEVKMTDMAVLYGSLANKGKRVDLNPIIKVINHQGTVIEEKKEIKEKTALPEEIAYIISNILADNSARALEFGLNSPLFIPGHTVSVKTGTTDNKRDNWTIGYTPNLLTAVWVGNNDNTPMNPTLASGITGAAPIWNKIMNNLLAAQNPKDEIYQPPVNIVSRPCNGRTEYFIKGTEKNVLCRPLSINDHRPNNPNP